MEHPSSAIRLFAGEVWPFGCGGHRGGATEDTDTGKGTTAYVMDFYIQFDKYLFLTSKSRSF
jgi:hypothetical protein